ncbi:MAG TPA: DUF2306 domain-containing protein [Thermoanaerobaculia bacterium]|nr:DUF2306 domain-containing protein [Thermoanaerobaculia bacterium]
MPAAVPARASAIARVAWWAMTVSSLAVALVSVRFLLQGPEALYPEATRVGAPTAGIASHFHQVLEERWLRFAAHFVFAPIALIVGPFQMLASLRARWRRVHRGLGWVYAVSVGIAGVAGLILAGDAFGGLATTMGFGLLAVLWLSSTALAVWHAWNRRFAVHRRWMVRSFALTFAAVTLRLYIPLLAATGAPFEQVYQTVAWLSWVPNLVVAEALLARLRA